jgi:phosphoglycolate phosphatase-like HAD superfamily hydrolase
MIEIIRPHPAIHPRLAVFDFDGTLSLVRSGWQQVMSDLIVETLLQVPHHEPAAKLRRAAGDYIARSTGQPTIDQMAWLAAAVERRGGAAESPAEYKRHFDAAMHDRIDERLSSLRTGAREPDALLVPGARDLLDALQQRSIPLALISGTDRNHLYQETSALQITEYFGQHIYGPGEHDPAFSKPKAIAGLLAEYDIPGIALVAFGDGPAETGATHAVEGLAVGVALDEEHGARLDPHKRAALIEAGASIIIPHFGEHMQLIELLFARDSGD